MLGPLNPAVRGGPLRPGCLNGRISPQFIRNAEYEVYHISKTTNRKYLKLGSALVSEHFTSFGTKNIGHFWSVIKVKGLRSFCEF